MEQVSLDLAKSVYSKYIDWDLQMYDPQTGTPAVAAKCVSLSILLVMKIENDLDGHEPLTNIVSIFG